MIWVITFEKSATKEEIGLKQTQSQKSLWSSGYGRRLIFERLRVRIPAAVYWIFHKNIVVKIVLLV